MKPRLPSLSPSVSLRPSRLTRRGDHGPAERWQHDGRMLELTDQAGVLAARVVAAHLLDQLALAKVIDDRARDAGLRLRADYQAAHMETRLTASYNPARGMNGGFYQAYERSDAEEAAYQRWRSAVRALGQRDALLVLGVCCHDQPPAAVQQPQLRRGLAKLGAHYGSAARDPKAAPLN